MVVLLILVVAAAAIWLIAWIGSREMVRLPGPDQPGYFPNGGTDVLPTQFSLGPAPLPDIEIAEHTSAQVEAPTAQQPREP
jgi:hypothetical protein